MSNLQRLLPFSAPPSVHAVCYIAVFAMSAPPPTGRRVSSGQLTQVPRITLRRGSLLTAGANRVCRPKAAAALRRSAARLWGVVESRGGSKAWPFTCSPSS